MASLNPPKQAKTLTVDDLAENHKTDKVETQACQNTRCLGSSARQEGTVVIFCFCGEPWHVEYSTQLQQVTLCSCTKCNNPLFRPSNVQHAQSRNRLRRYLRVSWHVSAAEIRPTKVLVQVGTMDTKKSTVYPEKLQQKKNTSYDHQTSDTTAASLDISISVRMRMHTDLVC